MRTQDPRYVRKNSIVCTHPSIQVWNHPEADKLFCEEIDVGEEGGPRQITSGLREHYTLEEMQDRKVLVVCNLKAAKIVGFNSNGMVLAAKVCLYVDIRFDHFKTVCLLFIASFNNHSSSKRVTMANK